MNKDITTYNDAQNEPNKAICLVLADLIDSHLPKAESKVWHKAPVWFLDGNPVVGYFVLKSGVQLLFWSGQTFEEPGLKPEGSFKAAEARYNNVAQVNSSEVTKWLKKAESIQWDYKHIVKNRGVLNRLK